MQGNDSSLVLADNTQQHIDPSLSISSGAEKIHKLQRKVKALKRKNVKLNESIRDIKIMHDHQYKYDMVEWQKALQECQMKLEESEKQLGAKMIETDNWKQEALEMKEKEVNNQREIKLLRDSVTLLKYQINNLNEKIKVESEDEEKDRCNTSKKPKETTLADDEWECVSCTFVNVDSNSETETKHCELCGGAKPVSIPIIMTSKDITKISSRQL